jgi:TonB family protein
MKTNNMTFRKLTGACALLTLSAISFVAATPAKAESIEIQPRKVADKVMPSYPEIARTMNLSGVVVVDMTVNKDGSIAKAEAMSGNAVLRNSALFASKRWKFEPASQETKYRVAYEFRNE